jgi:hypothetical protein
MNTPIRRGTAARLGIAIGRGSAPRSTASRILKPEWYSGTQREWLADVVDPLDTIEANE